MLKFIIFLSVMVTLANAAVATVFFDGLNEKGLQEVQEILSVFK